MNVLYFSHSSQFVTNTFRSNADSNKSMNIFFLLQTSVYATYGSCLHCAAEICQDGILPRKITHPGSTKTQME